MPRTTLLLMIVSLSVAACSLTVPPPVDTRGPVNVYVEPPPPGPTTVVTPRP